MAPEPHDRGMALTTRRNGIALGVAGVAVAASAWQAAGRLGGTIASSTSLDFLTANILLPAGGFFTCVFVGWKLDRQILRDQITNNGN